METNFNLIVWVLVLPLLGAMLQATLGRKLVATGDAGKRMAGALAVLPIATAFGLGAYLTSQIAGIEGHTKIVVVFEWIKLLTLNVPFELRIDPLSMTMVLIITGIGSLIHLYATGYMAEERDYARFFSYLNLFVACMLVLVLGNNLALLFIGWEGVGLCSYLLIGFWYKDLANSKAANKAFIVNRIGDWGLTLGIFLLATLLAIHFKELAVKDDRFLSYDVLSANLVAVLGKHPALATIAALLLFVGACGKSAQFPLYLWLPDAMAGPTPVSALIHAATMVTAGVFLMNRMYIVFAFSPVASAIITAVGAFTALFAALVAFSQQDIKKVLAYSTVSQLGFMFVGCGSGAYWTGMFHVTTHAFFKALLFLGSGAVIHAMSHDQDMRHYGGLWKKLPITFGCMFIGYLAIAGIPGFSGFFSKEAIIGFALGGDHAAIGVTEVGKYSGFVALFVAMLTAWYMSRMTFNTFFGKEKWRSLEAHHDDHGHDDHEHEHHSAHDHHAHGEDVHGFFYTDAEMADRAAAEVHEHHHALDASHEPKEVPPSMWIPLVVLAFLSAGGGWYLNQDERFKKWLYPEEALPGVGQLHEAHGAILKLMGMELNLMQMSMIAAGAGIFGGLIVFLRGMPWKGWAPFQRWSENQFYYDQTMVDGAVQGGREVGLATWKWIDVGLIDGIVNGFGALFAGVGGQFRRLQTGLVRGYALAMLAGGVGILGWLGYSLMIASRGGH